MLDIFAMRCTPPNITANVIAVITNPSHARSVPNDSLKASVIVLDCTELNNSPKEMEMMTAKIFHIQRLTNPATI